MPTITIPLQPWDEIPKLARSKRFQELAAEKIALQRQEKEIKAKTGDDEKTGTIGLNSKLYLLLDEILPDDVKSIEFEGYELTKIDAGESRELDKKALMERPLPCTSCPHCKRKKVTVYLTATDLEACVTVSPRKPTVRAQEIKSKKKTGQAAETSGTGRTSR